MAVRYFRRVEGLEEPSDGVVQAIAKLQMQRDGAAKTARTNEQQGLFQISGEPASPDMITHDIDIIAVHGLGGDLQRTWEHESGYNWLRNIHEVLPGARAFSYGYDGPAAFATGIEGLSDYARHLLALVKYTSCSSADGTLRTIVFICHGMGGLLVKQAVLLASNERGLFEIIRTNIGAILFFGTPHSGNAVHSYAETLVQMSDAILFSTPIDVLNHHFRILLTESLKSGAATILPMHQKFREHIYAVSCVAFIEQVPLEGRNEVLVDERSGRAGAHNERCILMMNRDHRQLCKFASPDDEGIRPVLDELQRIAKESAASSSPTGNAGIDPRARSETVERFRRDAVLKAVDTGNSRVVQRLLTAGANLATIHQEQKSLLHLACEHGYTDIVRLLLESGADVKATDDRRRTPLHAAVTGANIVTVVVLLEHGADPDAADDERRTPLHYAARERDYRFAAALLAGDADYSMRDSHGDLPASIARQRHNHAVLSQIQARMAEENQSMIRRPPSHPVGGYLTASQNHHIYMAQNFPSVMTVNIDLDSGLRDSASRLGKAAERGNLDLVRDLLDFGETPDPKALYLAALEHRTEVVAILADAIDDIDQHVGWTGNALCAASMDNAGYATVQVLLGKGASVNWQGGKYGNALQAATANYALNIVKLLLEHGADVNAQSGHYGNALTAAARHRTHFAEMATLFLALGADVNSQGPGAYGNPLQTAVHRQHAANVEFLLDAGASKTMTGQFGSALEIATSEDFLQNQSNRDEKEKIRFLLQDEDEALNELLASL